MPRGQGISTGGERTILTGERFAQRQATVVILRFLPNKFRENAPASRKRPLSVFAKVLSGARQRYRAVRQKSMVTLEHSPQDAFMQDPRRKS
jgi:hypothetical protein